MVYAESPWASAAPIIPVAIIYIAFSRLAAANTQLEETLDRLESLQGRIVSSTKLASIGAISLDLAHQIKNPLAVFLGRLEGLEDRLGKRAQELHCVEIGQEAGWRIQELTQTFNNIGRQEWAPLDMRELLTEGLGMAGLRTTKRIETSWSCPDDLPNVQGNPILIREALTNFFSNTTDALESGGEVHIAAEHNDEFLTVKIIDNGIGISFEDLKLLFQPFHTTKPNGQGLGLFASKHILEMHRGSVRFESEKGVGSTVVINLPLVGPEEQVNPFEEDLAVTTKARLRYLSALFQDQVVDQAHGPHVDRS